MIIIVTMCFIFSCLTVIFLFLNIKCIGKGKFFAASFLIIVASFIVSNFDKLIMINFVNPAILVALFSLFISGFTFWYSLAAPFNLKVTGSELHWIKEQGRQANDVPKPILVMTITLANYGARSGYVDDIMIYFDWKETSGSFVYLPQSFVRKEAKSLVIPGQHDDFVEGPFHSIYIGGKNDVTKTILFIPGLCPNIVPYNFEYGRYRVRIFIRENGETEWKNKLAFHILRVKDLVDKDGLVDMSAEKSDARKNLTKYIKDDRDPYLRNILTSKI